MRAIDTTGCPNDFRAAYLAHIHAWEMMAEVAQEALDIGFAELPVRSTAAASVADLPMLHRDPFDRLLIAQAIEEPAILFTADAHLASYSELVRQVAAR